MKTEDLTKTVVNVSKDVTEEEFTEALDKAYLEVLPDVEIKGFRKGHAPKSAFIKHYGIESLYQNAIEILADDCFNYLEEKGYHPIDVKKWNLPDELDSNGFTMSLEVYHQPEAIIGEYKNIHAKKMNLDGVDGIINDYLHEDLADYVDFKKIDDQVLLGDKIGEFHLVVKDGNNVIDDDPSIFYGLDDDIYFIKGFDTRAFEGMLVNETREFDSLVDKDAPDDSIAGKNVHVIATLLSVNEKIYPEVTDELVKDLNIGYESASEYLNDLKKNAQEEIESNENERILDDAINQIMKTSEVYPSEVVVNEYVADMEDDFKAYLKAYNIKESDVHKTQEEIDNYRKINLEAATKRSIMELIMLEIGKKEGMEVSDEEINEFYRDIAASESITVAKARKQYSEEMVRQNIILDKAKKLVLENMIFE